MRLVEARLEDYGGVTFGCDARQNVPEPDDRSAYFRVMCSATNAAVRKNSPAATKSRFWSLMLMACSRNSAPAIARSTRYAVIFISPLPWWRLPIGRSLAQV